jgi:hypothetical protein
MLLVQQRPTPAPEESGTAALKPVIDALGTRATQRGIARGRATTPAGVVTTAESMDGLI